MPYFRIKESVDTLQKGELFLRGYGPMKGHCHSLESVMSLLNSSHFQQHNPELIPVFEEAKAMMERGETGEVVLHFQ